MNWFERLTGFREADYESTRHKLEVDGRQLRSLINRKSYGIGELELVSLATLRARVGALAGLLPGRLKINVVTGDIRQMHQDPKYGGALFQVASQFNLLEMVSPNVTPDDGVTRYEHDATQGPACAMAAGAATIFRNYFVPVANGCGQTRGRQLDGLADVGKALSETLGRPVDSLWTMRNGYALCTQSGLQAIGDYLDSVSQETRREIAGMLRIGLHHDVEVTDAPGPHRPQVSQAFCSALPVRYTNIPSKYWKSFASLILQAAYEATMLAAVLNARRGASRVVLLTRLGGGAFGNDDEWISSAMLQALQTVEGFDLDVKLVSYGRPSIEIQEIAERFA